MADVAMPMFPLGAVLVPSAGLPLHVFEPRYRALVRDCLAGDHEFGVVLIERGSEVGGEDVRTLVGTVARIVQSRELPDGRWAIAAVGVRRVRVMAWLPDAPYPLAEVADWPDPEPSPTHADALTEWRTGRHERSVPMAVALGLVVGGAVGNLADRAFRAGDGLFGGGVVDFVDLQWWPVFNVADVCVVVGACLLFVVQWREADDEGADPAGDGDT
jgi:hypothetical protein